MKKENSMDSHSDFVPQFKPLSEGLGLNHFADGLPYTPAQTKRRQVHFKFPSPVPRAPARSYNDAPARSYNDAPARSYNDAPARSYSDTQPSEINTRAESVANTQNMDSSMEAKPSGDSIDDLLTPLLSQDPLETSPISEEVQKNAGGFRRSLAFFLDSFFVSALFFLVVWLSFRMNGLEYYFKLLNPGRIREQMVLQILGPGILFYFVFFVGYFLVQELTWKRTLGKALLGMKIVTKSSFSILGRALCFVIAALPLGLGLFWMLFDKQKRCWHDVVSNSEVVC